MKREQINLIPTIKFKKPQSINNKSKKIKKGKEEENPSDFEPTSYQYLYFSFSFEINF